MKKVEQAPASPVEVQAINPFSPCLGESVEVWHFDGKEPHKITAILEGISSGFMLLRCVDSQPCLIPLGNVTRVKRTSVQL